MPTLTAPAQITTTATTPGGGVVVDCSNGSTARVTWTASGGISGQRTVRNTREDVPAAGVLPDDAVFVITALDGVVTYEAATGMRSAVQGDGKTLRQVATGCAVNDSIYAPFLQSMSRSQHYARDAVSQIRLVYGAWAATNNGIETALGATQEYRASVVVDGVVIRATFGGAETGVCADGQEIVSDPITVDLVPGKSFHVLTWTNSTGGIVFTGIRANTAIGERYTGGVTATDRTGTDASYSDAGGGMVRPLAIIGLSGRPAIWLAGDSKQRGLTDTVVGATTNGCGEFARLVEPAYAYTNAGRSNEQVQGVNGASGYTRRWRLLLAYFTHVLSNYGINDCNSGSDAATIYAALVTFASACRSGGKIFAQATVAPQTSSTDGWTTTANQTVTTSNAKRVPLNASIRTSVAFDYVIELADVCESARDSGIWRPGLTGDGTHETQAGNAYIRSQLRLPAF